MRTNAVFGGNARGQHGNLLPPGVAAFLRRRFYEGVGLVLLAMAVALSTALLSYAPGDPSLNNATDTVAQNLLGRPGAYLSDLLLQSIGVATFTWVIVLAAWGLKWLRKNPSGAYWSRTLLSLVAVIFLAIALSALSAVETWPQPLGMGGVIGPTLFEHLFTLTLGLGLEADTGRWLIVTFFGGFGLAALFFALGITLAEWRALGGYFLSFAAAFFNAFKNTGYRFVGSALWRDFDVLNLETPASGPVSKTKPRSANLKRGLVAPKTPKPKSARRTSISSQGVFGAISGGHYHPPSLDLLNFPQNTAVSSDASQSALEQNAEMLGRVLEDFGICGDIVKVRPGPVVTLYELEPAPGTKTSRVIGLSDDIARSMSAISVRVAVVPGRNTIGIELPNTARECVYLRELLTSEALDRNAAKLPLVLGKDISGSPVIVDLARMPHLLIAGTTGSGKSVGINAMILSLLYRLSPEQCRIIMIDPKMLELSVYDGIPHLLCPVVTEPGKAVMALKWAVREMEERYRAMSQLGVRNIDGYNTRLAEARKKNEVLTRKVQTGFDDQGTPVFEEQPLSLKPFPYIVVVVDEMADLMLVAKKDIEAAVQRLAQMARAAGIHVVMATQRPSVDVITGTIKANFPTRISFQVTSKVDSRTIFNEQGAEQLLGQGDMLYMAGGGRLSRVHGPFVSDQDVEAVVSYLRTLPEAAYMCDVTEHVEDTGAFGSDTSSPAKDELYDEAVNIVARAGKASTSFIQRHLQIGYNRAARIIECMEEEGIVSKANRVGRRDVLVSQ
jgi:DNA segregation ATPase FtsK/SpoIIIE, S-DNA-T family